MAFIPAKLFVIRHDERPRIAKNRVVITNHDGRIDYGDRFPNSVIVAINING
jgi:hypothetical protein